MRVRTWRTESAIYIVDSKFFHWYNSVWEKSNNTNRCTEKKQQKIKNLKSVDFLDVFEEKILFRMFTI